MPDWSYQTVFRPLLFRLPATVARDVCLGFMGRLARMPLGPSLIDFLGHMRPDSVLEQSFLGVAFASPVGLGPHLDKEVRALPALARFGLGFLEIGPVAATPGPVSPCERRLAQQSIWFTDPFTSLGPEEVAERLAGTPRLPVPLIVRLGIRRESAPDQAADDCLRIIACLASHAAFFSLPMGHMLHWSDEQCRQHLRTILGAVRSGAAPRQLLLCTSPDFDAATVDRLVGIARDQGIMGVIVDGAVAAPSGGQLCGPPAREPALEQVRRLRKHWADDLVLIGAGGIHEPADALRFVDAGANLVQVDSGLVYAGPGLPKRINDALVHAALKRAAPAALVPATEMSWFWLMLLGVGMLMGGLLAMVIATTRVVLPYDEVFSGMSREQLARVNDRLLAFMAHDRVTLAGTMITIGVLYFQLAFFGVRRGLHWAKVAIVSSAFTGFGSFFLFLGFGYFDPFHAFVTAILFQLLLLGVHSRMVPPCDPALPNLYNDRPWLWNQWGQLLFLIHGAILMTAGTVICVIGSTHVFVPEDLEFMQTTAEALRSANPRLVPLVAHDRASFGGMLLASGLAVLLSALWGFRQGSHWLWWTFLVSGGAGYTAAIGVHLAVGYVNLLHLLPAFAGALLLLVALFLSRPYLCRSAASR